MPVYGGDAVCFCIAGLVDWWTKIGAEGKPDRVDAAMLMLLIMLTPTASGCSQAVMDTNSATWQVMIFVQAASDTICIRVQSGRDGHQIPDLAEPCFDVGASQTPGSVCVSTPSG